MEPGATQSPGMERMVRTLWVIPTSPSPRVAATASRPFVPQADREAVELEPAMYSTGGPRL